MTATHPRGESILFVVTEDWYFVSHRLQLAERLIQAGHRVALATRFTEHREAIERAGIECLPLTLRRRATSLWAEASSILELRRLYRRFAPDIVHHVAMKPVVFGGLAAIGLPDLVTVNAIAGLGFLFSSSTLKARAGRVAAGVLMRHVLGRDQSWVIVQNKEDAGALDAARIGSKHRLRLIGGAGVDLQQFSPQAGLSREPVVTFAGRMLRDKGVSIFVEAARRLKAEGVRAHFQLVGEPDPDNPRSHSLLELQTWQEQGDVSWLGRRNDMPAVLAASDMLCLPTTYGEGVPKILLEAAASGVPVIATDWPGCRDVVEHGVSGLLVPAGDVTALVDAIRALCADPARRERMGQAGRARAEREFSIEAVTAQTMGIYREALAA